MAIGQAAMTGEGYDARRCQLRHWWLNWSVVGLGGLLLGLVSLSVYAVASVMEAQASVAALSQEFRQYQAAANAERQAVVDQLQRIENRLAKQEDLLVQILRERRP